MFQRLAGSIARPRVPPSTLTVRMSLAKRLSVGRAAPVLLLALLGGCTAAHRGAGAPYREGAEYSRRFAGEALLVVRGDSVMYEEYSGGYRADEPHRLHSGTKSFACAIAAAAVEDGLLDLDEPLVASFPELRGDTLARSVTPRQLLGLTSGLTLEAAGGSTRVRMRAAPGSAWAYDGAPFVLFGELMARKLDGSGETLMAYLDRRVLSQIGVSAGRWRTDGAGNPTLASGGALTAREWAAFGRLMRDAGRWEGRQVLAAERVAECFRPGAVGPGYGLAFWLYPTQFPSTASPAVRQAWERVPRDVVRAAGFGQQRLFILPSLDLVVVRFGHDLERPEWSDGEFLARLLGGS